MQIKTTVRYHFIPLWKNIIKKPDNDVSEDVAKLKPMCIDDRSIKWHSLFGKHFGCSSRILRVTIWLSKILSEKYIKEKLKQSYCITQQFTWSIVPREMKTCVRTKTCAQMLTATLWIVAKTQKRWCSSLVEWINKLWSSTQWNTIQH